MSTGRGGGLLTACGAGFRPAWLTCGLHVLTERASFSNPSQAHPLHEPRCLEALERAYVAALQAELGQLNAAATSQPELPLFKTACVSYG